MVAAGECFKLVLSPECRNADDDVTGVYFVPNYFGLYSVKVISTDNSVQRLQNKKLNKTKGDCTKAVKIEIADS